MGFWRWCLCLHCLEGPSGIEASQQHTIWLSIELFLLAGEGQAVLCILGDAGKVTVLDTEVGRGSQFPVQTRAHPFLQGLSGLSLSSVDKTLALAMAPVCLSYLLERAGESHRRWATVGVLGVCREAWATVQGSDLEAPVPATAELKWRWLAQCLGFYSSELSESVYCSKNSSYVVDPDQVCGTKI